MSGFFSTTAAQRLSGLSDAGQDHDRLQHLILASGQRNAEHDQPNPFRHSAQSRELQSDFLFGINEKFAHGTFTELANSSYRPSPAKVAENDENTIIVPYNRDDWRAVDRYDIMCRYLFQEVSNRNWLDTVNDPDSTPCVALRIAHNDMSVVEYRCFPPEAEVEGISQSYIASVAALNVEVALKLSYPVVKVLLNVLSPNAHDIELSLNTRIQVLDRLDELPRARKYQYAAFIRSEDSLVIWADNIRDIVAFGSVIERKMVEIVWDTDIVSKQRNRRRLVHQENGVDLESGKALLEEERPVKVMQALCVGIAIMIVMTFYGLMFRTLALEAKADGNYFRLLAVLYLPPFTLLCAFFCVVVSGIVFMLLGPVAHMKTNSAHYSAIPPRRISPNDGPLPHITIQCPVYKESLDGVIDPTMQSLLAAVTTYELQGGTANIFVNDDGLQIISEEEADARRRYYGDHLIGYVARPPHGENGFVRKGRFKKASNMNYCLHVSNKVEELLEAAHSRPAAEKWTEKDEIEAYEDALATIARDDPTCWLAGDIRVGDIILLVDSDTRVPEDCLLDAASEFHHSPDVAILQNSAGVMMVVNNYWENLIAWFTRLIYFAIQYATAAGDAAAFVGHNAFLRWSAVQEVAYEEDGIIKYWSESHVSEDFEISLKLRCKGYTIRLAAYHGEGFKEGVSLSVYDEITRWQKYAYGCSELMFMPVANWYKGVIFTSLFRRFLFATEIKFFAKFTVVAYIGTYYAIAASLLLTVINYFVIGWYNDSVDHIYTTSFNNFIAAAVVFSIASPVANSLVRYRVKADSFWSALVDNYRWTILMAVFMGGLSWHLNLALLSHMLGINMQWGATAKELEASNFFKEFPKIVKGFIHMYITVLVGIAGMVVLAFAVPWNWKIEGFYSTLPLGWIFTAHFLSPIVLNPQLMTFSF
ncbi:glycosyl transferase family group 2-domain-containing protein [Lipomyces tetrasporus]|uniref:Glycosyl transferase family group 2-domain-containing protein n=1 Tax=Lipomyces tetrasporus TaxID=54092 RepID=A0AAD7VSU9_9ASCO|nr:glycosyl transferase family group 2-domain-containing protein [Lipomyces tetrasporus]KAJ8100763.1 glycosyl transferase family group 2-domain-containing protein [Lipomyces tetrasporus]